MSFSFAEKATLLSRNCLLRSLLGRPTAKFISTGGASSLCSFKNYAQQREIGFKEGSWKHVAATHTRGFASEVEKEEIHDFKAETKKLLDIVTHSLYTDKEIFLRELISNSSDALEKLRFTEATGEAKITNNQDTPLRIIITADDVGKTLTIQDTGVGMTREELIENLGTIAKSGSLEFLKNAEDKNAKAKDIIGQFGVGFYSSFVVADEVEVYTRHYDPLKGATGWKWVSKGLGSYSLREEEGITRGTKIVLKLKPDCYDFSSAAVVKKLAEKYSSFVSFPLYMMEKEEEKRINVQEAIWLKSQISEDEHIQFFRFLNGSSSGEPLFQFTFRSDAPLSINSLFYFPEDAPSRLFQPKPEVGVSLYSRRVLIKKSAEDIIPRWLFFLKGVVDCEDMPLNVSRESMQDHRLIEKLSQTLVQRILRFLEDQSKSEPEKYKKFYDGYAYYLKEGLLDDAHHSGKYKDSLMKLLRFDCSSTPDSTVSISFDEYISMMKESQKNIYYLCSSNKKIAMQSPYIEQFLNKGRNVLLLYEDIDEFVAMNLQEYKGKKFVAIDSSEEDFEPLLETEENKDDSTKSSDLAGKSLISSEDEKELEHHIKSVLGGKVSNVKFSDRLVNSPAVVTGFLSSALRKMMKASMRGVGDNQMGFDALPVTLELNSSHPLIKSIVTLCRENSVVSKIAIQQLYDNACIAAGIVEDPRSMLDRLNEMLHLTVDMATSKKSGATDASAEVLSVGEEEGVKSGDSIVEESNAKEEGVCVEGVKSNGENLNEGGMKEVKEGGNETSSKSA